MSEQTKASNGQGLWYNFWTCKMFKQNTQTFGERNCTEHGLVYEEEDKSFVSMRIASIPG